MINTRRVSVSAKYNNVDFSEKTGADIESITYVDSASDNSDSIDITINAQDSKWMKGWMPEKGSSIKPKITGKYWGDNGKGTHTIKCGRFILDDITYNDKPSTLTIGGVAKPSNENFSERERSYVWKNTSIKRIGQTIAERYGLSFTYDADDYEIECDEQDDTDSTYFNNLCKNYGLILKIYAKRMFVYDREAYKEKKYVKEYEKNDIIEGTLSYNTTLSGTYTGGDFNYTDSDKNIDISCSIGGGAHTMSVNRKATSVLDASIQLCADINNANHGTTTLGFSVHGEWKVSAGQVIRLKGYSGLNGDYFVDKITHKYDSSSGFTSALECSAIETAYHYWDVGGSIKVHDEKKSSSTSYQTTSAASNASSKAAGAKAGASVTLKNAPFYPSSTATQKTTSKSGTFHYYDGILVSGRYRIASTKDRCGKLPVAKNVVGWVPSSYCS
jgi:hypothetical protein